MKDLESQLWVNTLFRGQQIAEFLAVKKHLGIQSNTDVVRYLIHKQARNLRRLRLRSQSLADPPSTAARPASRDRDRQEKAAGKVGQSPTLPGGQSLCLSCSLPDCDEADPRCRYRQAIRRREEKT